MKKFFSRTIILFFIIAILFGSFGVNKVEAIADNPECSGLTGAAQSNCDYYYNNIDSTNTSGYVEITNPDGSKNRYYPNGNQTVTTSGGVTNQVNGITTTETVDTNTPAQTNNNTSIPQDVEVTVTGGDGTSIKVNSDGSITDSSDKCGKVGKPGSAQQTQCYIDQNCAGMTSTQYDSCRSNILRSQKNILGSKITEETGGWFEFSETLKNMPGVLADGVIKSAIAVVGGFIQLIILPVLGIILRITAACLDLSVQFALDSTKITGVNGAITEIWVIVRNIFNITFIFILLWSAIQTIIGIAGSKTKEIIAHVVVAALLINFSLFVTRILIDAGNILAINLYNSATAASTISNTMMQMFGISALYSTTGVSDIFSTSFFVISALQLITILTAIITMSYIAMMMIVRNVMLIFLMAISPIGFMGDVLPKLKEYSKMWWDNLYGQIFIAPIFLLFYYLITLISTKISAVALTGENKDYTQYFKYVMLIILLVAAVKVTKKMSGVVGSVVEKFGTAAAGIALGAATGGAALLATKTLGAGASAIRDSKWGEKLKDSNSFAARMTIKGLDKTAKSSFDARNTSTFKGITGFVGDQTGIKVDYNRGIKTQKDGFEGTLDRNTKRAEDYAKMVTKNMPDITEKQIVEARTKIDTDLIENQRKMSELNLSDTTQQNLDKINELETEKKELEKRKALDNDKLKKEMEKEAKKARVNKIADDEKASAFNWLVGGAGARKAAAAKVRKLAAEKTAAEIRKEAEKKQKEEDKAAGIKDEEEKKEDKPKEEKKEEKKEEGK